MTVGIALTNKNYGVMMADSRLTLGKERSVDAANKLIVVKAKNYEGAMVGAGDAGLVFTLFEYAKSITCGSLENFIERIQKEVADRMVGDRARTLRYYKNMLEKEAEEIYTNEEEKRAYVENNILEFIKEQDRIYELFYASKFIIAAFDKKNKRIRKFELDHTNIVETSVFESIIGSGSDAAGLELMRLIPGLPLGKLCLNEMTFLALCAYVRATQNIGVGGVPKIALIEKKVRLLEKCDAITLANLVAAYEADIIQRDYVEVEVAKIINREADYQEIANKLELSTKALQNYIIPLDSWVSSANSKAKK